MATIITSSLVSDIRGSINGNTFQRGNSGLIVRSKPRTVGRGSNQQNQVRNYNAELNYAWSNLTDAQRSTWSSYAIFCNGNGKTNNQRTGTNTGKSQFFAVNFWLLQYGKPLVINPAFALPEQVILPYYNALFESDNLGKCVGNLDTSKCILVTKVSLPQSLATNTATTGERSLIYNQVNGNIQNWAAEYQLTYGIELKPYFKYWVELQVVNFITGSISPVARRLILYKPITQQGIGSMIIESTFIVG